MLITSAPRPSSPSVRASRRHARLTLRLGRWHGPCVRSVRALLHGAGSRAYLNEDLTLLVLFVHEHFSLLLLLLAHNLQLLPVYCDRARAPQGMHSCVSTLNTVRGPDAIRRTGHTRKKCTHTSPLHCKGHTPVRSRSNCSCCKSVSSLPKSCWILHAHTVSVHTLCGACARDPQRSPLAAHAHPTSPFFHHLGCRQRAQTGAHKMCSTMQPPGENSGETIHEHAGENSRETHLQYMSIRHASKQ